MQISTLERQVDKSKDIFSLSDVDLRLLNVQKRRQNYCEEQISGKMAKYHSVGTGFESRQEIYCLHFSCLEKVERRGSGLALTSSNLAE